jgi:YgiT-type zinc finger domain-containing protein
MGKSKIVCENCSSPNMTSKVTDFPIKIGPRTIVVSRVPAKCCTECGRIYPTKAGAEKIERLMNTMSHLRFF